MCQNDTEGHADSETFQDRLRKAMKFADNMSQSELARRLGDKRPDLVGPWYNNGRLPEGKFMIMLPEILGVDGHWLLTGEGEMAPVPDTEAQVRLAVVRAALDRDVSTLVREGAGLVAHVLAGPSAEPGETGQQA